MRFLRLPLKDPRTISRDIPGVSESLFPSLVPGVVAYLNRTKESIQGLSRVPQGLVDMSSISAAMLFEVAYVRAEKMLSDTAINNDECLQEAIKRQTRYFDAEIPKEITFNDQMVIDSTATNLVTGLRTMSQGHSITTAPKIPGLEWISSSVGDFAFGENLVEIKCTAKNFSANDYRQLLFYWLLNTAKVINTNESNWEYGVLFNPRLNFVVSFKFDELLALVSGGRDLISTIELLQSILVSGRRD